MKPFRLRPVYLQPIWADNYLTEIRHLDIPNTGISREVCAYKGSENVIEDGEYAGMLISDLIREHHEEVMGDNPDDQLVRVAYMSSKDDLSIQVHPNQEQAESVGDYEKSESWYVLRADEGARIYAGVNTEDKEVLRKAIEQDKLEDHLITKPVKEGDFVLIPADMIHANGRNMLVLEIGSYGGITYRLYDFGRGRKLDVETALEICDPSLKTEVTHHPYSDENKVETGVDHRLFHSDIIDVAGDITISHGGRYEIYTCVRNYCIIVCEGEEYRLNYTETLFVPASAKDVQIRGNCRVLRMYKP